MNIRMVINVIIIIIILISFAYIFLKEQNKKTVIFDYFSIDIFFFLLLMTLSGKLMVHNGSDDL